MGNIITAIEEKLHQEDRKKQKAYLVALASCIRETEPGTIKHQDILWLIKHRETILKHKKLIEALL